MKKSADKKAVKHPLPPVWDGNSRILILGSFPSVKSREEGFFYGHPQNRFWRLISALLEREVPGTVEEKREMLLTSRIALWDVIGECEIEGSSDGSIRRALPNNLEPIIRHSSVRHIFLNGKTAEKYFLKHHKDGLSVPHSTLPSTSPANAKYSLDALAEAWAVIKEYL